MEQDALPAVVAIVLNEVGYDPSERRRATSALKNPLWVRLLQDQLDDQPASALQDFEIPSEWLMRSYRP